MLASREASWEMPWMCISAPFPILQLLLLWWDSPASLSSAPVFVLLHSSHALQQLQRGKGMFQDERVSFFFPQWFNAVQFRNVQEKTTHIFKN